MSVQERFQRDCDAWREKSKFMSSSLDMATLPEYQRIIGLGPAAVPLIVQELRKGVDHWFWALVAIVGEDHGVGAHTVSDAATKWIAWFDSLSTFSKWRGGGRTRIDTVEELRELPMLAVVYDHDSEVWQKRTYGWYSPGSDMAASFESISLPAYLLDDGL